jgi:lipase chaperone LimK
MNLRTTVWGVTALALGAAAAFGVYQWRASAPTSAMDTAIPHVAPPGLSATATAEGIPAALQGTTAPPLPLDEKGHLRRAREVRDFFDYFLTARNQLSDAALDAQVMAAIHAQTAGKPAQDEAAHLWERYRAYLAALDMLPTNNEAEAPAATTHDFDSIEHAIAQRAQLASAQLGEWAEVFFADEWSEQRYFLARARLMADTALSAAEKVHRLDRLEQNLPAAKRKAMAREQREDSARKDLQQALQQDGSPEAAQAAAQQFGPQAVERAARFAAQERDWRERYAQYAAQRAQIDAQNLAPEDHQRQLTQLRQQYFSDPGDARRAAAFDGS